jgi:hypothetical protein
LEPPLRNRREGWAATLGLYDTLYRRFKGYRFVTFPVRVPLVGLVVKAGDSAEISQLAFSDLFELTTDPVRAVSYDVGHLFLGTILPNERIEPFENRMSSAELAHGLRRAAISDRSVVFLADGVLALQVFAQLSIFRGVSIRVVGQGDAHRHELSYRIGFMLREEDHDLAGLLDSSQRELFRTSWRATGVFRSLFDGVGAWLKSQEFDQKSWPEDEKLFLLRRSDLAAQVGDDVQTGLLLEQIRELAKISDSHSFIEIEPSESHK